MKVPVLTIDGASGTGKGSVAQLVASQLKWNLLDSGALYRVLAYAAEKHHLSLDDAKALEQLAGEMDVVFCYKQMGQFPMVKLEGQDVTQAIRTEHVGNAASKVGALPAVRTALLEKQRAFRQSPGLVTDGRDMGTVVFPDAFVKIFLTASPEERARRRFNQLKDMGVHGSMSDLVIGLRERDKRDQERAVAPLKPATDAVCIDTDHLTIEQVVECIMVEVGKVSSLLP